MKKHLYGSRPANRARLQSLMLRYAEPHDVVKNCQMMGVGGSSLVGDRYVHRLAGVLTCSGQGRGCRLPSAGSRRLPGNSRGARVGGGGLRPEVHAALPASASDVAPAASEAMPAPASAAPDSAQAQEPAPEPVVVSGDARAMWGPLTEGLSDPNDLDLSDRPAALGRLGVSAAANSRLATIVKDYIGSDRETALLVATRAWPLDQLAVQRGRVRQLCGPSHDLGKRRRHPRATPGTQLQPLRIDGDQSPQPVPASGPARSTSPGTFPQALQCCRSAIESSQGVKAGPAWPSSHATAHRPAGPPTRRSGSGTR